MIIRRSQTHKINQGNYESVEIGASVEVDTTELTFNGKDVTSPDEARKYAQALLDLSLHSDLEKAKSQLAADLDHESYIEGWSA